MRYHGLKLDELVHANYMHIPLKCAHEHMNKFNLTFCTLLAVTFLHDFEGVFMFLNVGLMFKNPCYHVKCLHDKFLAILSWFYNKSLILFSALFWTAYTLF